MSIKYDKILGMLRESDPVEINAINKETYMATSWDFGDRVWSDWNKQFTSSWWGWPLVESPSKWGWTALWATNASSNARSWWKTWQPWMVFLDWFEVVAEYGFELPTADVVWVQESEIRLWLLTSIAAESTDCVYIRKTAANANFQLVTRSSNLETAIDSGVPFVIATNYKLRFVATSTEVKIYMAEYWSWYVLVWTINSNIPTGWIMPCWYIQKTLWDGQVHKLRMDYYTLVQYIDR